LVERRAQAFSCFDGRLERFRVPPQTGFRVGRAGATPDGVAADDGGAGGAARLRPRDGGGRGSRAPRDARTPGSWAATPRLRGSV